MLIFLRGFQKVRCKSSHANLILCSDSKYHFTVILSPFIRFFVPLLLSENSFPSLPAPSHISLSAQEHGMMLTVRDRKKGGLELRHSVNVC